MLKSLEKAVCESGDEFRTFDEELQKIALLSDEVITLSRERKSAIESYDQALTKYFTDLFKALKQRPDYNQLIDKWQNQWREVDALCKQSETLFFDMRALYDSQLPNNSQSPTSPDLVDRRLSRIRAKFSNIQKIFKEVSADPSPLPDLLRILTGLWQEKLEQGDDPWLTTVFKFRLALILREDEQTECPLSDILQPLLDSSALSVPGRAQLLEIISMPEQWDHRVIIAASKVPIEKLRIELDRVANDEQLSISERISALKRVTMADCDYLVLFQQALKTIRDLDRDNQEIRISIADQLQTLKGHCSVLKELVAKYETKLVELRFPDNWTKGDYKELNRRLVALKHYLEGERFVAAIKLMVKFYLNGKRWDIMTLIQTERTELQAIKNDIESLTGQSSEGLNRFEKYFHDKQAEIWGTLEERRADYAKLATFEQIRDYGKVEASKWAWVIYQPVYKRLCEYRVVSTILTNSPLISPHRGISLDELITQNTFIEHVSDEVFDLLGNTNLLGTSLILDRLLQIIAENKTDTVQDPLPDALKTAFRLPVEKRLIEFIKQHPDKICECVQYTFKPKVLYDYLRYITFEQLKELATTRKDLEPTIQGIYWAKKFIELLFLAQHESVEKQRGALFWQAHLLFAEFTTTAEHFLPLKPAERSWFERTQQVFIRFAQCLEEIQRKQNSYQPSFFLRGRIAKPQALQALKEVLRESIGTARLTVQLALWEKKYGRTINETCYKFYLIKLVMKFIHVILKIVLNRPFVTDTRKCVDRLKACALEADQLWREEVLSQNAGTKLLTLKLMG